MKLKRVLVVSIILLTVFLIYLTTMDKKVYFVGLGDDLSLGIDNKEIQTGGYNKMIKEYLENKNLLEKYIIEFSRQDMRTTDLINAIEENQKIEVEEKEKTIKNVLIKADLVTLSIGSNDLSYKIKTGSKTSIYNYIEEQLKDIEKLFQLIKEYCKEDILYIGLYNPFTEKEEEYYAYANEQIKKLCKEYKITWIDSNNLLKNIEDKKNLYPSSQEYQIIGKEIIKEIQKTLLK